MHASRRPGRSRFVRAPAALVLLAVAGCGLFVTTKEEAQQPDPGQALVAFRRDVGIEATPAAKAAGGAADSGPRSLPPLEAAKRDAWALEREAAIELYKRSRPENRGLELGDLPAGEGRVERLARARGMVVLGRRDEAVQILNELLAAEARYFPAREILAAVRTVQDRHSEAVELLRLILADFDHDDVRLDLGHALCVQKAPEARRAGLAEFERLVNARRSPLRAAREAARFQEQWVDAPGIERTMRAVLAQAPKPGAEEFDEARLKLGLALWWQRKLEEARVELAALCQRPGDWQAPALFHLIRLLHDMGRFADAVAGFHDFERGDFESYRRTMKGNTLQLFGERLRVSAGTGQRGSPIYTDRDKRFALRRHEDAEVRRWALEQCVALKTDGLLDDLWFVLENDADAGLRAEALSTLAKLDRSDLRPVEQALKDRDARVRTRAIELAVQATEPGHRPARLLELLAAQDDPGTFRYLHQRLAQESGIVFMLESGAEASAESRRTVTDEWRRKLAGR